MPKWSILICTIGQRNIRFLELLDSLMKQVRPYKGEIEVLAYWNNGEKPLAQIRQDLVEAAKGEYISFIDDDDVIPDYYCDEVMKALRRKPDYVGWQMQAYHNGDPLKPTFHSIKYDKWFEDDKGFYRNISHLNPIKRNKALKVSFTYEEGSPEDYSWAKQVAPYINTEVYIDKLMYHYYHTTEDSTWRGDFDKSRHHKRPIIKRKYFRYIK